MTAAQQRRGVRTGTAATALVLAWLVAPHAVPLYDGIGLPDEPYRYVKPPAGYQQTPAARTGKGTAPAASGANSTGFYVNTGENSTQYGVFITPHALTTPAGATSVTVVETPVAPEDKAPQGTIDGNIYRVQLLAGATSTGVAVAASAKDSLVYTMRSTSTKIPAVAFLYRPSATSPWVEVQNERLGTDSFQAYFQGAGDYALVPAKAAADSSSHTLVIVLLVLIVVAMTGAVVLIRLSRRTRAPS